MLVLFCLVVSFFGRASVIGLSQAEALETGSQIEVHCNGCDSKGLRIMATYDKSGWFGMDHIMSGNWVYVSNGGIAYNSLTFK